MAPRLTGLTKLTLETAPSVCHECIWWQTRGRREVDKDRWIEKVEHEFGAFGTVYYDSDGRVLGSMQYGPAAAFPRATELPAGPAERRRDARHVRVPGRVVEPVGAAVALPRRDRRGARPRRAWAGGVLVPLSRGRVRYERFRVHKTVFPQDFLADFGFEVVRTAGRISLSRLELGGLVPVEEGAREKVLRVVRDAFGVPEPVPSPPPY